MEQWKQWKKLFREFLEGNLWNLSDTVNRAMLGVDENLVKEVEAAILMRCFLSSRLTVYVPTQFIPLHIVTWITHVQFLLPSGFSLGKVPVCEAYEKVFCNFDLI